MQANAGPAQGEQTPGALINSGAPAHRIIHAIIIYMPFTQLMSVSSASRDAAYDQGRLLDAAADTARDVLRRSMDRPVPHNPALSCGLPGAADVLDNLDRLQQLAHGRPQAADSTAAEAGPAKPLARLTLALRASPEAERRNAPRFPHFMPCILAFDGHDHATETLDIGRRGILLRRPEGCTIRPGQRGTVWFSSIGMIDMRVTGLNAGSINLVAGSKLSSVAEAALNGLILRLRSENDYQAGQVRMLAATVVSAFEAGLADGRASLEALLDRHYTPVAGTAPQQFTTRATPFYDSILPDILARFFNLKSGMIHAVITDRNGYVPVHNQPCNPPQRPGEPACNRDHARQRRIHDDTVTLRAARFARDTIIQTCQRDVADGPDLFVKNIAAPVVIRGRRCS
jgi:methyl-accepting chemotaxis protein